MFDFPIAETLEPIRPGGINGRPFWNTYAKQFIYVPSFDFPAVNGAAYYRFEAEDRFHNIHSFTATSPTAPLTPVWNAIPAGPVYLTVDACDRNNCRVGTAGARVFYRNAPFNNGYPSAARSYAQAAKMAYDYLFNLKLIRDLADGEPDMEFALFCYPSKMHSSIITGMVNYAEMAPENKAEAIATACGSADHLIKTAVPQGDFLEYLPLTYQGNKLTAAKYSGTIMMIYPAEVGSSMINLYNAVKDVKYLDYAVRIGEQYLKLQQENGSWHLILNIADGKPARDNFCVPVPIMEFLEQLSDVTGQTQYRQAAERGLQHLQDVFATFNWEGQFEDVEAQAKAYHNLTLHSAASMFLYLCGKPSASPELIAQAREVLRFAEDQFVIWEQPGWAGTDHWYQPRTKEELQTRNWGWLNEYRVPCALEQYLCYVPVDSATAKMARFFLMMYKLEKNPLDLAKARALCDSLTRWQNDNGRIPTWGHSEKFSSDPDKDWFNCMFFTADTLKLMAEFQEN